ncbi:MAG: hypothetical protein AB1486_18640 [Planctomycetota bacterium]
MTYRTDILTPGENVAQIERELSARFGNDVAADILSLRSEAIEAMTIGDFPGQVRLGGELVDRGRQLRDDRLISNGYYLIGEGHRFSNCLEESHGAYAEAALADRNNVRALRGLAISHEQPHVAQSETEAGLCYRWGFQALENNRHLMSPVYAAHEQVRLNRHYGSWLTRNEKKSHGSLDQYHRATRELITKYGTEFDLDHAFWLIDQYKTQGFLGLMAFSLGVDKLAVESLVAAIETRKTLIQRNGVLSPGDRVALGWWDRCLDRCRDTLTTRPHARPTELLAEPLRSLISILTPTDAAEIPKLLPRVGHELIPPA